jgi:hypothetical protein
MTDTTAEPGDEPQPGDDEYPTPGAEPSASAPGSVPERREEIERKRRERVAGGDGPAAHGTDEAPAGFKEALEADPELGGAKSQPD